MEPAPFPHGELTQLDDGLHVVHGRWKRSPLGRRMTVFVAPDRRLAIHSAMRLREEEARRLEELGEPSWILVPNRFHASEASWYSRRYPSARVLVPAASAGRLGGAWGRVDGTHEADWPAELAGILERQSLGGLRIAETAFLHAPSRTLVLTDLCFNLSRSELPGPARVLMRLNGALDRFGPTRLLRWFLLQDRAALRRSVDELLRWDFERVIVSHGQVVETRGRQRLEEAFRFLGSS